MSSSSDIRLRGLYAVTPDRALELDELLARVAAALRGGARLVQYRDKGSDSNRRVREASALRDICAEYGGLFIVNDDPDLAAKARADGVHLGGDDQAPASVRATFGQSLIIGVSCYNSRNLALRAVAAGADYVAFGSFFPSSTKTRAVRADTGLLRFARESLPVPAVAIGGITPENGGPLLSAGADMLAVVEGLFGVPDTLDAARRYSKLFEI